MARSATEPFVAWQGAWDRHTCRVVIDPRAKPDNEFRVRVERAHSDAMGVLSWSEVVSPCDCESIIRRAIDELAR